MLKLIAFFLYFSNGNRALYEMILQGYNKRAPGEINGRITEIWHGLDLIWIDHIYPENSQYSVILTLLKTSIIPLLGTISFRIFLV